MNEREAIREAIKPVVQRGENAVDGFISDIAEQFGFSVSEAEHILRVFLKERIARIDYGIGKVQIKHGAYWEREVMEEALNK